MTMPRLCLALALLLPLLAGACSRTAPGAWERRVEPDLDTWTVYEEASVERGSLHIATRPRKAPPSSGPALLFPLQIEQEINAPRRLGRTLGRVFARSWSREEVFSRIAYAERTPWPGLNQARAMAEARGADFILQPVVTHLLLGSSSGTTSLSLSVVIYTRTSDRPVWSMAHSGRMDRPPDHDYVLYTRKVRMPAAPESVILAALCREMAAPVRGWLKPEALP